MKIALISDWYAESMGYAENFLPKALASLGAEVHLIAGNVQPYFDSPTYATTYEPFIGPGIVSCGTKEIDGYTLHRLPHSYWRGRLRINDLRRTLSDMRPDIVQTFDAFTLSTLESALYRNLVGYKLFLESHMHASVFGADQRRASIGKRLKWMAYAKSVGRAISLLSEKCYPISTDSAEIAIEFYGIQPGKIEVCSLGVDTDLFRLPTAEEQDGACQTFRKQLGIPEDALLCVYTGRFSSDKNPLCLAQAVDLLAQDGVAVWSLFVGAGDQKDAIQNLRQCVVQNFVPATQLPEVYWAGDIGVWPRQESTSQLDAAASGLPLVVSDQIHVPERIEGNGLVYIENDPASLAQQIRKLLQPEVRQAMGAVGAQKVHTQFSWKAIARLRLQDYAAALER
ncbi:MAG: glycosyltransferase family 4 protein [Caldilineaceae bacterium]|nr:glycosyltransferase family 4 protein [Caldilineaceae bacterium]HRJ40481.1 glycosyltransferase family 4 protein [Caldilineaceae bacterium]